MGEHSKDHNDVRAQSTPQSSADDALRDTAQDERPGLALSDEEREQLRAFRENRRRERPVRRRSRGNRNGDTAPSEEKVSGGVLDDEEDFPIDVQPPEVELNGQGETNTQVSGAASGARSHEDAGQPDRDEDPWDTIVDPLELKGEMEEPFQLGDAQLDLPAAPERRQQPRPRPRPLRPWWDWRAWRTRNKVLSIVAVVISSMAVGLWFALPSILAYVVRQELPALEARLGRKLAFEGVELDGFSGVALTGVTVFENVGDAAGSGAFFTVDRVALRTDKSPAFYRDFKVTSIELEHPRLHLTRGEDGSINFRDITDTIERLTKPRKKKKKKPSKPNPLLEHIKPLPEITIRDAEVVFDDDFPTSLTVPKLESSEITLRQEAPGAPIEFSVRAAVEVRTEVAGEHRIPMLLEGAVKNSKEGQIRLSFPRGYELPLVRPVLGRGVRLDAVTLQLPSTIIVDDLIVEGTAGYQQPLLAARQARAALTQLPPKRVGGVYIKETEIDGLRLDLVINEEGQPDIEDLLVKVLGPTPTPTQELGRRVAGRLQRGARSGIGLPPPKPKKFNVRDYFVTQRLLLDDGLIRIEDRRPEVGGVTVISDLQFELGYRGIQKLVEVAVGFEINTGESGRAFLSGSYALLTQDLDLHLELENLSLTPFHRPLEATLHMLWERRKAAAASGANPGVAGTVLLYLLGTALHLEDTVLSADLDADLALASGDLHLVGSAGARDLRIEEPSLSQLPLDGLGIEAAFDLRYDRDKRLLHAARFDTRLGALQTKASLRLAPVDLSLSGTLDAADGAEFDLTLEIPDQPAQQVLEGIPYALRSHLDGMQAQGTFGFGLHATGRLDQIGEMDLETTLNADTLRIVRWPSDVNLDGLNEGMMMTVHDPKALMEHTIVLPPSTHAGHAEGGYVPLVIPDDIRQRYRGWTLYEDLSPWLVQLVTTTEDGSFFRHAGFSRQQVLSALQKNIDEGGFARGASTISMQLIKNVFLGRQKTVARKLQELTLTWLMESVVKVPKKRILEVYFNVIEFGPEIYGIHDAARYYFGKLPKHLTLRETAFLVSIIPRPRTGEMHKLRGEVTSRMSNRIDWYIRTMHKRKCDPEKLQRIRDQYAKRGIAPPFSFCCPSESQLERLIGQAVTFYNPSLDHAAYRPELYTSDGVPVGEVGVGCGLESDDLDDSSLLEGLDDDEPLLPAMPVDPEHP